MKAIVGSLLLVGGFFKISGLFSDPVVLQQPNWLRIILPFEIASEFGIGILALCGTYWRQVRWIVVVLFTVFAAYTLSLALQGAKSCGCFGSITVNPWLTFGLDVAVVVALIGEWYLERWHKQPTKHDLPVTALQTELRKLTAIGFASVFVFAVLVWQTRPVVHANGLLQTVSGLTILEPTDWSGQPFPLSESIDIDLSRGEWLVVLHRHDCHDCQEAVPLYETLAESNGGKRVALIEVPPFAEEAEDPSPKVEDPSPNLSPRYKGEGHVVGDRGEGLSLLVGRLTADREWFVQTPVEIQLRDGVVVAASAELPAIRDQHYVIPAQAGIQVSAVTD